MVFTASLLGAQYEMGSVEDKPPRSLFVSFGKALNEIAPSLYGRQEAGPVYPSRWPSTTKDFTSSMSSYVEKEK